MRGWIIIDSLLTLMGGAWAVVRHHDLVTPVSVFLLGTILLSLTVSSRVVRGRA